jgi:hypothetical protein
MLDAAMGGTCGLAVVSVLSESVHWHLPTAHLRPFNTPG